MMFMLDKPAADRRDEDAAIAGFEHVNTWVFDLDNTLYPAHSNLFGQIDDRISHFVQRLLNTDAISARTMQKDYYKRYGTTLRGLMTEHGISPDEFLEYVHDIDHSVVAPDPRLGAAIDRLPGRKFILTNGSRRHAEKTAERLGIVHHFEDIFDIVAADLVPKPHRDTYDKFLALHGLNPTEAAMFEDLARNLEVPHALGMRTVLVVPSGTREVFRDAWELDGRDQPHVEVIVEDLGSFLETIGPKT